MIHEAATRLDERGFTIIQQLTDDCGTIGYALSFLNQRYCLVAKEYAYENMASFMARLVETLPEDFDFIFYCADDDRYTIFDGDFVRKQADPSQGASKKREVSWREIERSHGALLHKFIRGIESPDTLSGNNATLEKFA